jgi:hypothetical protein
VMIFIAVIVIRHRSSYRQFRKQIYHMVFRL